MPRSAALVAVSCAVVAGGAYVLAASPAFYWLDSAEFVAAAWDLGVAHPPGHPLAALVNRLACYLPIGSIAFRVGLASALLTVGALVVLGLLSLELLAAVAGEPSGDQQQRPASFSPARGLVAAFGALAPAFSYSLWFSAVRAEVYALNLLLLLLGIYLLLRGRRLADGRHTVAAAFVFGLALCNHHLLALLALPGALLLLPSPPWSKTGRRALLGATIAVVVALSLLAYLPLRSQRAPRVNWGAPHTLERFGWVVSAKAFQGKSAERAARETVQHRGVGAAFAVMGGPPAGPTLMLVGGLLLLLGLYGLLLLVRCGMGWVALGLGLLLLLNLLGPMLVGFDPYNADAYGYLALTVALLGPLAALGLFALAEGLVGGRVALVNGLLVVALALPALRLALNWPRVDLHGHWAANETAHELLELPPGALLVSSYFQSIFGVWALQGSEDARPDVQLLHRGFIAQPGYLQSLRRRYAVGPGGSPAAKLTGANGPIEATASLAGLLRALGQQQRLHADLLRPLAAARHVAVEYDLNLPPSLTRALALDALTLRVAPNALVTPRDVARHRHLLQAYQQRLEPVVELETRRALVWRHFLLAHYSCARGIRPLAAYHLAAAQRLAPVSRHLLDLGRACLGQTASPQRK